MNNLLSKIWNSPSARNVGKLLSANVIAQAIGILVYPILTRIYSPEDFGLLNLFLSIGGILILLSTCEYQNAILLPSREDEAVGVAHISLRLILGMLVLIGVTIPFAGPISQLFRAPELSRIYWLLLPYVGILGCWSVANIWLTRARAFGRISSYQLNQSALGVVTKMIFGWVGWLRCGLVFSSTLSPLIALIVTIGRSKDIFSRLFSHTKTPILDLANRYYRFPLYSMPRTLVNNLSGNLPTLLLTPYFGLEQLGFFGMAITLAFRPITMITGSLYQVLFERVAKSVREKQSIAPWLKKQWILMAAVVLPIMAGLTIVMPWLVRIFLGDGWTETALLIRYMMPWLICVFMIAPLAFVSEVFGKQRLFLVLEVVYLGLRVFAIIVGILMNSFEYAIIGMSAAGTLMLLTQGVCYAVILRRYELERLTQGGE